MKTTRILTLAALLASTLPLTMAIAADEPVAPGDIVAVASGADNFKTLVTAIKAAGLVETLQGRGPSRSSLPPTRPSRSCRRER